MVYIRIKKISGKKYVYLVENISTPEGPRQKVKQYLGKVFELDLPPNTNLNPKEVHFNFANDQRGILLSLIIPELIKRGFKKKEKDNYVLKNIIFDSFNLVLHKVNKSGTIKEAIILCNEGYLCSFTIQRLLNFKKTSDLQKDGYLLAKYFQEAGLIINQDYFIQFYKSLN